LVHIDADANGRRKFVENIGTFHGFLHIRATERERE
jgi:hypothetical protein